MIGVVLSALVLAVFGTRDIGTRGSAVGGAGSSPPSPVLPPSSRRATPDGSQLTVYLVTMGYGDNVWERFGHNAIRIVDAARGTDSVYNWGTFDFDQPNFLQRFMTGNTLYWMQGDDMRRTMEQYRYLNRSVWVQELDLTAAQRESVRDFIAWNALPENRYYRYDYYKDNCSTRVRDIIDRAIGGQLRAATESSLTATTYRFHTQRLLQYDEAVALGTMIGLGGVADRPLAKWEEMFLPRRLQEHVRGVQVTDDRGATRPLVKAEQQLFEASRPPEATDAPSHLVRNLGVALVLAALLVTLRLRADASRASRRAFATLATLWAAVNGLLGVILIVGWSATRHVFMARNENLFQFDPLSLAVAVALPMAILAGRAASPARTLTLLTAAVAVLGLLLQALPGFDQVNGEVIALVLPVHLVLAWAVRGWVPEREPARARRPAAQADVAPHSVA